MPNVFNPQPEPEKPVAPARRLPVAWQPFTFRGVAAFAGASYNRLFWVQVGFAIFVGAAIVWSLCHAWTPVVRFAVRNLPNEAPVRTQQLTYPPSAPPLLAESSHLAVLLNPEGQGVAAASDVRIEFRPATLRLCSLLGCLVRNYPKKQIIYLTRQEAIPWWDAWEPIFLGIIGIISALFFLALWTVLATVFFLPIRLYAYFADRQLTLGGSWLLAATAFLPGSLALILAMVLYALGIADLIRFSIAIPGHLSIALIYLAFSPLKLERLADAPPSGNPFSSG